MDEPARQQLDDGAAPVRVLVVSTYMRPSVGGVEEHTAWLVEQLQARGMAVDTVACRPSNAPCTRRVPALTVPGTGMPLPLLSPGSLRRLWRLVGAADLVLLQGHTYPLNLVVGMLARARRRPVATVVHTSATAPPGVGALRSALMRCNDAVVGVPLLRLSRPIGLGRSAQAFASQLSGRPAARASFPLRPLPERRAPAPPSASSPLVVVHAGRLALEKRPEAIVAACEAASPGCPVELHLYGSGPLEPRMHALAAERPWLHVHGARVHEDVLLAQAAAHVTVCASMGEATQVAVLEAVAMGVPVVSTRVGDVPDYLTGELARLLVDVDQPEHLGDRLQLVAQDIAAWDDAFAHRATELRSAHDADAAFDGLLAGALDRGGR